MGLGTKIKDAFSGDKDHHSSRVKKAPGAYPESVATPRTTTTDVWKQPNTNKPLPEQQDGNAIDDPNFGHYTLAHDDELTRPQRNDVSLGSEAQQTGIREDRLSKDNEYKVPYWGDVGTAKTTNHDAVAHHQPNMPHYQDRDASMFPSDADVNQQIRDPMTTDEQNYNSGIDQRQFKNGAGNRNSDNTFQPADTVGRGQYETYDNVEVPAQAGSDRLDDPYSNAPVGGQYAPNQTAMGRGMRDDNTGMSCRDAALPARERSSSMGVSDNGSANPSSVVDHYGPGHAGAKVLHRCQHCGHDNDISRYFNKDVVYRLS
ncbi:hypothetical protein HJFPF1_07261 [Paramyrothecium foliicola]|nr:hypothetical protein HJFPF1_07261 [Paramyrothecium foliicola]